MSDQEHREFYEHKRLLHSGAYDGRCETCRELWQLLVQASKRKAGGAA